MTTVRVEADDGEEYDSPSSLATIEPKSETRLEKGKSKAVDLPNDSESSIPASLPTIEPKAERQVQIRARAKQLIPQMTPGL